MRYVEQLVVEIFARDLICSMVFYQQLGFELLAHRGRFVELACRSDDQFPKASR